MPCGVSLHIMTPPDASIIQYQNRPSIRLFVPFMFSQKPKYAASGQLGLQRRQSKRASFNLQ